MWVNKFKGTQSLSKGAAHYYNSCYDTHILKEVFGPLLVRPTKRIFVMIEKEYVVDLNASDEVGKNRWGLL